MNRVLKIKQSYLGDVNPPIWWRISTHFSNLISSMSFCSNGLLENFLEYLGFDFLIINSPMCLRLINLFNIPNLPLINIPFSYLDVGWNYHFIPIIKVNLCMIKPHRRFPNDVQFVHKRTALSSHRLIYRFEIRSVIHVCLSRLGPGLGSVGSNEGSFRKDPWMVLGDFNPDVCNPNKFVYDIRNSHKMFHQKPTRKTRRNRPT